MDVEEESRWVGTLQLQAGWLAQALPSGVLVLDQG